ncbi:cell division protein ZapE, partial [Escherichia coli]|nr:cell division protein ZapE [Escherichia coli]
MIAAGELRPDAEQRAAADCLDALAAALERPRRGGLLARLTGRQTAPRGVYMWGDVGRGKSMLMDLFFA